MNFDKALTTIGAEMDSETDFSKTIHDRFVPGQSEWKNSIVSEL